MKGSKVLAAAAELQLVATLLHITHISNLLRTVIQLKGV